MKAKLILILLVVMALVICSVVILRAVNSGTAELQVEEYADEMNENFKILQVALLDWSFSNEEYPEKIADLPLHLYDSLINPYTGDPVVEVPFGGEPSPGNIVYLRTDAANYMFVEPFSDNQTIKLFDYYPHGGFYLFAHVKSAGNDINLDGIPDGLIGPVADCIGIAHYHGGSCGFTCPKPLRQVLEELGVECHEETEEAIAATGGNEYSYESYDPPWPTKEQIDAWQESNASDIAQSDLT